MYKKIYTFLLYSILIILLLGFTPLLNPTPGFWYQQYFPNLHGASVKDVVFTDSLTGYAITGVDSFSTAYILKTTNAGDNWFNSLTDNTGFNKIQFLNNNTGFVSRMFIPPGGNLMYKTTSGGNNWFTVNTPSDIIPIGMSVVNEDSIWIASPTVGGGGIYRTTNGGTSWTLQYDSPIPDRIYMYNGRIGFMGSDLSLNKTTNSGDNWFPVPGGGFMDIHFVDSLTGWKSNVDMKKTTDGGLSWVTENMPNGGIISNSNIQSISVINPDTIWGSGGGVYYVGGRYRATLYRTINGGVNWFFKSLIPLLG